MGFIPNAAILPIGQQLAEASRLFSQGPGATLQLETGIQFNNWMAPQPTSGIQSFQQVMASTIQGVNQTVQAPEGLMKEAMAGGRVDIHDAVMASTKAELAVSLTSQTLTKVIQAYDRISQIQV